MHTTLHFGLLLQELFHCLLQIFIALRLLLDAICCPQTQSPSYSMSTLSR